MTVGRCPRGWWIHELQPSAMCNLDNPYRDHLHTVIGREREVEKKTLKSRVTKGNEA